MNEIWLIRHGETEWSLSGQHTGRTDIALTPHGEEQARRLAPALAGQNFTQILTSPLQRARHTCRLAGLDDSDVCEDLREWDYGIFEGRTTPDIRKDYPDWSIWEGPLPEGETLEQVAARAQAALDRCTSAKVALFAHGHILRVLAACWLQQPPQEGRLFALSTASISVLGFEHQTHVIQRWNSVP
jgi:broad specificity phosphatase PhoE